MTSPERAQQFAEQRQAARRALVSGRRWFLRSILMMVIAVVAFVRGGSVYIILGVTMLFLSLLALSLGRTVRRQAHLMLEKLDLMEHTTSEELGELSG